MKEAREILQRLRSNGVKVSLNASEQVQFSSLDNVSPQLKADIITHGGDIKNLILAERRKKQS